MLLTVQLPKEALPPQARARSRQSSFNFVEVLGFRAYKNHRFIDDVSSL